MPPYYLTNWHFYISQDNLPHSFPYKSSEVTENHTKNRHYKQNCSLCVKVKDEITCALQLIMTWYLLVYPLLWGYFSPMVNYSTITKIFMSFFSCNLRLSKNISKIPCGNVKIVGFLNDLIYNETFSVITHFQLCIRPPERAIL